MPTNTVGDYEYKKFTELANETNTPDVFATNHSLDNSFFAGIDGYSSYGQVTKFGRAENFGTTMVDVAIPNNLYPWATSPFQLDVSSTSASDTNAGGAGARAVLIEGLDENWDPQQDIVSMAGLSTVTTDTQWIRVNRALVLNSGTYGGTNVGVPAGVISIQRSGGGGNIEIQLSGAGIADFAQSQIARYSTARNKGGWLTGINLGVNANKPATFYLWARVNANETTAPVASARVVAVYDSVAAPFTLNLEERPWLPPMSDFWFSVVGSGTGTFAQASFSLRTKGI